MIESPLERLKSFETALYGGRIRNVFTPIPRDSSNTYRKRSVVVPQAYSHAFIGSRSFTDEKIIKNKKIQKETGYNNKKDLENQKNQKNQKNQENQENQENTNLKQNKDSTNGVVSNIDGDVNTVNDLSRGVCIPLPETMSMSDESLVLVTDVAPFRSVVVSR